MKRHASPLATTAVLMLFVVGLPLVDGCGKSKVPRHDLSGRVTFQDKPVPVGLIVFEPDASRGNRGPQGYAQIFDGRYETERFGKGAILGALNVEITGFPPGDGSAGNPTTPLFPPYKTQVRISDDTHTLDFEVPVRR
jgi:hypothetical protein